MFRSLFSQIFDNTNPQSISSRLRTERFKRLNQLINRCSEGKPLNILDIGGDDKYWNNMLNLLEVPVNITLINLVPYHHIKNPRIKAIVGDGCDLSSFANKSFDLVISNSVIEHVGTIHDQKRMASEIQRVGKGYFIQTPNRCFPLEPHFLIPFFQFLPTNLKIEIAKRYKPGWYRNRKVEAAVEDAQKIRLLSKKELMHLFPDGKIWEEKYWGITKSFVVYKEIE